MYRKSASQTETLSPAKKVLFTSHTANFQKFNHPFMKWFKDQGYEVHYASIGEEPVEFCDKHFNISFNRSPYSLDNLKAYGPLKKIINDEAYETIHTHTPMGSVVTRLAARGARKKYGTRVIYTAHGFHFFRGAPKKNWAIFYPVEKTLSRYTDTLVTINKEDYWLAKNNFSADVRYVPGVGLDKSKFKVSLSKSEKTKLRKSLGLSSSDFIIIYNAEICPGKRQTWLIKSLKDLLLENPSVQLLLVGMDSMEGACQRLVNDLGLQHKVHFLGYRNDIPLLLSIADMAVSASNREGLPVNIMEAIYMNLPVVVTDCRGNRDLVQDNYNGYIVGQTESEELVDRIKLVMTNKSRIKELLANGQEVIKNYTLDIVLPKMGAIYNFNADDAPDTRTDKATDTLIYETGFFSELPTHKTASARKARSKRISRRVNKKSE